MASNGRPSAASSSALAANAAPPAAPLAAIAAPPAAPLGAAVLGNSPTSTPGANNAYLPVFGPEDPFVYNNGTPVVFPNGVRKSAPIAQAMKEVARAKSKLTDALINQGKKMNAVYEAEQKLKELIPQEVSSIIPIDFKGDGLGYTAGYGYDFSKKKPFANFAAGFPYKYYRVLGNDLANVTGKAITLKAAMNNLKTKRQARNFSIVQRKAAERNQKRREAEEKSRLKQQQNNLAMEELRVRRLGVQQTTNTLASAKAAQNATNARLKTFRDRMDAILAGTAQPETPTEEKFVRDYAVDYTSYAQIPDYIRKELEARFVQSPSFSAKMKRFFRSPEALSRAVNAARVRLGYRAPNAFGTAYSGDPTRRRQIQRAMNRGVRATASPGDPMGPGMGAPKPAATRRGFFSGIGNFFRRGKTAKNTRNLSA